MKQIVFLAILFLFSQITFAQIKVDEYPRTDSDSESARIDGFRVALQKAPESKGLIVIHSGENNEVLADALRDIKGMKLYLGITDGNPMSQRVFFKIIEGKPSLFKEFWIYPKESPTLKNELKTVNLDNLKTKYLFTSICAECEPTVPMLSTSAIHFELYANLLKQNPTYKGLIIIYPGSYSGWSRKQRYEAVLGYAIRYRDLLVKEYKISNRRFSIKVGKATIAKDMPIEAKFYIVPDKKISKTLSGKNL
jgi:hypothetical protein